MLLARLICSAADARTLVLKLLSYLDTAAEEKKEKEGEESMVTAHTNKQRVNRARGCAFM